MNRIITILALALMATFSLADTRIEYEEGKILVKFKPALKVSGLISAGGVGATVSSEIPQIGWTVLRIAPTMSATQAVAFFKTLPSVNFAEYNLIRRGTFVPNDPGYSRQYGLKKIQCEPAWDIERGKASVTVAVLDTGVDYTHPDLAAKCLPGKDFINNDNDPMDDNGHGTHCAGNVGASTNNGLGVAGVAINCKIIPVKVLSAGGGGSLDQIIAGMTWAADNRATVISMSLGGGGTNQAEEDAVAYVWNKGSVLVCAAGNNGTSAKFYPAAIPQAIAVAATDSNDQRAGFSNFGADWCDIAAPGVDIYSTFPGGQYGDSSGTSMACPIAAGACALVASKLGTNPRNIDIRNRIENNCDFVGSYISKGRVNVKKALPAGAGSGTVSYPPTSITKVDGTAGFGGLAEVLTADNRYFAVSSTVMPRIGQVASAAVTYTSGLSANQLNGLSVKMEGSAGTGITCGIFGWNWATGAYVYIGAVSLPNADTVRTFVIPKNLIPRYVSSSKQVKLLLRAVAPTTTTRTAMQFNFRTDMTSLIATPN